MDAISELNAEQIIDLCSKPINSIRQAVWSSETDSSTSGKIDAWGGCSPVLAIDFGDDRQSSLFVGASDTALFFRLSHRDDYQTVLSLTRQLEENDRGSDDLIGMFDLASVVCPVSEWNHLDVTKVSVVTTNTSATVVGICLWINLGIRIGLFVAPYPGITLSFNDTCDSILRQAAQAQQNGLVHIVSKEFANKETPEQIETIDWYDWLRQSDSDNPL
ncbi:MAG: hypothetical protein KDA88_09375 [Planctomycetaceae bacterium]|nr:hypothetical protein [Planctomycetaceae bacterium]MCB9951963.1 hypothetical protein [Planctomycetaceae bacterium]